MTYLPPLDDGREAVVAFTGHAVIASRLGADQLADLSPDGFGGALSPAVLLRLAARGAIDVNDVTMVACGTGHGSTWDRTGRWDNHPRVQHARRLRHDVVGYGDERGLHPIAEGLAGRREMSIEVIDSLHGSGAGRALIAEARGLVPPDEWLFAAISPGNARSLRPFLAQGFIPIGSEVLITPR